MVHGRNVFYISNILCTSAQLQATNRIKNHYKLFTKMQYQTPQITISQNVYTLVLTMNQCVQKQNQNQKKITCDANVRT